MRLLHQHQHQLPAYLRRPHKKAYSNNWFRTLRKEDLGIIWI